MFDTVPEIINKVNNTGIKFTNNNNVDAVNVISGPSRVCCSSTTSSSNRKYISRCFYYYYKLIHSKHFPLFCLTHCKFNMARCNRKSYKL